MVDLAGQQIGNYHLAERIAGGGMADIYLARHTYLARRVAVKILHSGISEAGQNAFIREARFIEKLKHPHIIPIYDFGIHSGGGRSFAYLVMEYASGSLADRHPPGTPVPFATIRSYVSAIASALSYAHNQNIVHLDVKPSNILVSEENNILLSDFGIATFTRSDATDEHIITGTPMYMAPEQVTGARITAAADQYALGCVIYQWLSGFPPFAGDNPTELIIKQVQSSPAPLGSRIPAEINEIVLKALAKNPEQRFPDIQAFADALDEPLRLAALTQPLPKAPPPASPYSAQPGGALSILLPTNPAMPPQAAPPVAGSSVPVYTNPYLTPQGASAETPANPWITQGGLPANQAVNSSPDASAWGMSPYYQSGPPTITGYRQAAYNGVTGTFFPGQANAYPYQYPYAPAPPLVHRNPLLLLLSLLAAPFVLVGRVVTRRNALPAPSASANGTYYAGSPATVGSALKNFCIMYHHEDRQWAEWIAWHLEADGYTTIMPDWDFEAGRKFDLEMTRARTSAERVIVVLSPTYLGTSDNLRTLRQVVSSKRDTVLPIVVHEYDKAFKHPLRDLVALNLVNLSKEMAQARLLSVAHHERQKPLVQPAFPPELELLARSQTNIPVTQPVPPPITPLPDPIPNSTFIAPRPPVVTPDPSQQQTMVNPNITIVIKAQDLWPQNPNYATFTRSDETVRIMPGGNPLTIEQNALKVAAFLKTMREYVIANPEFGRYYSDAGRMDTLFSSLATNLALNFQRLEEARNKAAMNPARRQYQDDVDAYLEGLMSTSDRIEQTWQEFRINTSTQIDDLRQKIELESEREEQEEEEKTQKLVASTEDAAKAERKNWLKTALNGLVQFKDFLVVATDIDKAVTQWPAVMEVVHHAFNALTFLHF
ncbi:MAG TPA: protein kinase [Ktedonobacteraceae bacterium]|nr:protein kinase [Ktedonobacteraceae bacterium]